MTDMKTKNESASSLKEGRISEQKKDGSSIWRQQELDLGIGQPAEDAKKSAEQEKDMEQCSDAVQTEKPIKRRKRKPESPKRGTKFTEFEPNEMKTERIREFVKRGGINFHMVNSFLGYRGESVSSFATSKNLPKGATATTAWMLGTTAAYLTGKTDSKTKSASRVRRPIMEGQTVMVNHKKLIGHEDDLIKRNGMTKDMAAWLVTGDRLVTNLFLERIAASIGCKPKQLMKRNPVMYKYDEPILGLYDKWKAEQEKKERRKAKRMQKASGKNSEGIVEVQNGSEEKSADDVAEQKTDGIENTGTRSTGETVSNEYQDAVCDNCGVDVMPSVSVDLADDCKDAICDNYGIDVFPSVGTDLTDDCKSTVLMNDVENDDCGAWVKPNSETEAGGDVHKCCGDETGDAMEATEDVAEDESGMTLDDLFDTLDQLPIESLDAVDDYIKSLRIVRNAIKKNQELRDKLVS